MARNINETAVYNDWVIDDLTQGQLAKKYKCSTDTIGKIMIRQAKRIAQERREKEKTILVEVKS